MADLATRAQRALDALRKADAGRTPGEWVTFGNTIGATVDQCTCFGGLAEYGHEPGCGIDGPIVQADALDAAFIAHVANAWPAVLDLIEATIADPTRAGTDSGPKVCYRLALAVLLGADYDEGNES